MNRRQKVNRSDILGIPKSVNHEMCGVLENLGTRRKKAKQTYEETMRLVVASCSNWLEVVAQTKYKITSSCSSSPFLIPGQDKEVVLNTDNMFSEASRIWDIHSNTKDNVLKHIKKKIQRLKGINSTTTNRSDINNNNNHNNLKIGPSGVLSLLLPKDCDLTGVIDIDGSDHGAHANHRSEDDNDDDDDVVIDDGVNDDEEENFLESTNQILGLESGKLDTTVLTGDERLDMFRELLDMFNWEREDNQIEFHEIMIQTVLPKIFAKEWDTDYERIMRMFKMEKHKAETFIICPRRYGKTVSVAMFCAAYLYMVPNASIAIFSTSKRTSGKMMTAVYGFMRELPFFDQVYFETKNSECIKIVMYGDERSVWSYPGTVAVCIFPACFLVNYLSFLIRSRDNGAGGNGVGGCE